MKAKTKLIIGIIILILLLVNAGILLFNRAPEKKNEIVEEPSQEDINPLFNEDNQKLLGEEKLTVIRFDKEIYDLDTIKAGEIVFQDIEYTNVGANVFEIVNVKASCGCTVPSYDDKPIQPGQKGKISIEFNSRDKSGLILNSVGVYGNVEDRETSVKFQVFVKQ